MANVYCEVCGQVANGKVENPTKLTNWIHREAKKPVTCGKHGYTRLFADSDKLKFNPLTGKPRSEIEGIIE